MTETFSGEDVGKSVEWKVAAQAAGRDGVDAPERDPNQQQKGTLMSATDKPTRFPFTAQYAEVGR